MKAVMVEGFGPIENAAVRDVPEPVPGPGEVLVAMRAADVNFPDILVMEGAYQVKPPLPFSPGKAGAGIVEAVGAGATRFKPGDRVAAEVEYGAYAEKMLAAENLCYPLPKDISFEDAAALSLVYQTAHFALLERAGLTSGDRVLVLGASGGVGLAAVQLARALGAATVIAGVRSPAKAQVVTDGGADVVVNLSSETLRDDLRDQVHEATGGHGADIVIDPVGGAAHAAALRAMAWRGRMVIVGFASGEIPQIRSNYLLVKNIAVSGLQWSDYRDREPEAVANVQAEIFALCKSGKLVPHISRVFPLTGFATALGMLKAGEAEGKIVLSFGAGEGE
ncbi:MAG: NADPH:quinone oxidoreductase family protein [Alphaproteobacteria bacterium]|nr:NADPH:quinone oxidoreductase family protein [Alphaproteobacteria bacterium]